MTQLVNLAAGVNEQIILPASPNKSKVAIGSIDISRSILERWVSENYGNTVAPKPDASWRIVDMLVVDGDEYRILRSKGTGMAPLAIEKRGYTSRTGGQTWLNVEVESSNGQQVLQAAYLTRT